MKKQIVKSKLILLLGLAIWILFDIEYMYITVSSRDIMEESLNRKTSASIGKTWNMSSVCGVSKKSQVKGTFYYCATSIN